MTTSQLFLASASPRRKELLTQLGYQFEILVSDIEEKRKEHESPEAYVSRLSVEKADACLKQTKLPQAVILGADTIVVTAGKEILEKPDNFAHSHQMLRLLSGSCHEVMTAITVMNSHHSETMLVKTKVWFKDLSEQDIEQYWLSGEPCDKAGSYGIQGIGGKFVTRIEGSYHAVVGLPLYEADLLLHQFLSD
ncbi:Maf family protein [Vibrio aerogenes]|nr:Maf family protein [Vibrio aerogenes]